MMVETLHPVFRIIELLCSEPFFRFGADGWQEIEE